MPLHEKLKNLGNMHILFLEHVRTLSDYGDIRILIFSKQRINITEAYGVSPFAFELTESITHCNVGEIFIHPI